VEDHEIEELEKREVGRDHLEERDHSFIAEGEGLFSIEPSQEG